MKPRIGWGQPLASWDAPGWAPLVDPGPRWRGAGRLVQVALAAGLSFELAWLEYPTTRGRERRLKNQGSAYRRCPMCRGTGGPLDPAAAVAAIHRSPLPHPPSAGRR